MPEKTSKDPRMDNRYMALVDDIRSVIWRWIGRELISEKEAARQAGLHPKTVSNFLGGHTMAPQLPTLYKLTKAAGAEFVIAENGKPAKAIGKKKRTKRSS
jgi:hypothetical protein